MDHKKHRGALSLHNKHTFFPKLFRPSFDPISVPGQRYLRTASGKTIGPVRYKFLRALSCSEPPMAQPSVLAMTTLLTRYSAGIPSHQPGDNPVKPRLSVILIIGTRGGLGTNLLVHLLLHKDVTKVYALNRAHLDGITVFNRQANEFKAHGLPEVLALSSKLDLLEGDPSKSFLGLEIHKYQEVCFDHHAPPYTKSDCTVATSTYNWHHIERVACRLFLSSGVF